MILFRNLKFRLFALAVPNGTSRVNTGTGDILLTTHLREIHTGPRRDCSQSHSTQLIASSLAKFTMSCLQFVTAPPPYDLILKCYEADRSLRNFGANLPIRRIELVWRLCPQIGVTQSFLAAHICLDKFQIISRPSARQIRLQWWPEHRGIDDKLITDQRSSGSRNYPLLAGSANERALAQQQPPPL